MHTMHLFAGGGGGLLADLIVGHTPVCAVEWDAHACAVLRERSAEGWFPGLHVHEGDVRAFDFRPWARRVDCLSAGFPCQDISAAGAGEGLDGSRSGLVSEVFRGIDEIGPNFVWLENSPRIRTKGRDIIIRKLLARGYSWRDGILGAADVDAGHQRDRWWLLAANNHGMRQLQQQRGLGDLWRWSGNGIAQPGPDAFADIEREGLQGRAGHGHGNARGSEIIITGTPQDAAHPMRHRSQGIGRPGADQARRQEPAQSIEASAADDLRNRLQSAVQRGGLSESDAATVEAAARYVGSYNWSPPDAGVCRVVDGLASRMDRIKCCGNGQVPLQAAAAFLMLAGL